MDIINKKAYIRGNTMKGAKKAKAPKKVKKLKEAKKAVKRPLTKEEKQLVKLTKKELINKGKLINKRVGRTVGFVAVILCIISSVLDVLLNEKDKASKR